MSTSTRLLSTGLNSGNTGYGRIVGADGVHFVLDDGRRVVDASNTAAPLGHRHPRLVEAVQRAAGAPVVNEGWAWPEREEVAEELLETAFAGEQEWVGAVRFFLSGSEANDLALSLAQALTGRTRLATRERAYHGMTGLARDMTVQPHWHGGLSAHAGGVRPVPRTVDVVELPGPRGSRIGAASLDDADGRGLADAEERLRDVAAVIVDYSQGGAYHDAAYQDELAGAARRAGALWVADEVVTGFGRMGGWFAFQGGRSRPDIVTLGKPLAGGAAPAGAIVVSREVLAQLEGQTWQTYSTFRGHPITMAAIRATLRVLAEEGLVARATALDAVMESGLRRLAEAHPSVARIDGRGLHWTVELHAPDWRTWRGDTPASPVATRVAAAAARAGALIGTSGERASLFLAPPLIVEDDQLATILDALDQGLAVADRDLADAGALAPAPRA